jgi:hypothetical protein
MQIFEGGTFTPLTDEQLGSLSAAQVAAYNEVADAARLLADAEADLEAKQAQVKDDVAVLADAEKNAPKGPTFFDEWRRMTGKI